MSALSVRYLARGGELGRVRGKCAVALIVYDAEMHIETLPTKSTCQAYRRIEPYGP